MPIILAGEAEAVEREDGIVDHLLFTLSVNAKPADIPNELTVDISALEIGDSIRVGDLTLPSGVTTDVDPEEAVVIASITQRRHRGRSRPRARKAKRAPRAAKASPRAPATASPAASEG